MADKSDVISFFPLHINMFAVDNIWKPKGMDAVPLALMFGSIHEAIYFWFKKTTSLYWTGERFRPSSSLAVSGLPGLVIVILGART